MFVGLGGVPAGLADEFCLRDPVLACCISTVLAAIGRAPGVNLDPHTPSVFRSGAQYREENARSGLVRPSSYMRYWCATRSPWRHGFTGGVLRTAWLRRDCRGI